MPSRLNTNSTIALSAIAAALAVTTLLGHLHITDPSLIATWHEAFIPLYVVLVTLLAFAVAPVVRNRRGFFFMVPAKKYHKLRDEEKGGIQTSAQELKKVLPRAAYFILAILFLLMATIFGARYLHETVSVLPLQVFGLLASALLPLYFLIPLLQGPRGPATLMFGPVNSDHLEGSISIVAGATAIVTILLLGGDAHTLFYVSLIGSILVAALAAVLAVRYSEEHEQPASLVCMLIVAVTILLELFAGLMLLCPGLQVYLYCLPLYVAFVGSVIVLVSVAVCCGGD